jgi:hypothetical protein
MRTLESVGDVTTTAGASSHIAWQRVPKLLHNNSARERICELVAPWSRSLNDYPAQAMARPGRYINTSRMTWKYP